MASVDSQAQGKNTSGDRPRVTDTDQFLNADQHYPVSDCRKEDSVKGTRKLRPSNVEPSERTAQQRSNLPPLNTSFKGLNLKSQEAEASTSPINVRNGDSIVANIALRAINPDPPSPSSTKADQLNPTVYMKPAMKQVKGSHEHSAVHEATIRDQKSIIERLEAEVNAYQNTLRALYGPGEGAENGRISKPERTADDQLDPKNDEPKIVNTSANEALMQIKKLTVDVIFARISIGQIYKEWNSIASLAALAFTESTVLADEPLVAKCQYFRGIALYHQKSYWEAEEAFERSSTCLGRSDGPYRVLEWLEKSKQAQNASPAPSSTRNEYSLFRFRTDSNPIPVAPGALRSELGYGSDFDSPLGACSRNSSALSLVQIGMNSPVEQQSRSPTRSPENVHPQPRARSTRSRIPLKESTMSPLHREMLANHEPNVSSPLSPRRDLIQHPVPETGKPRPTPVRWQSTPNQDQKGSASKTLGGVSNAGSMRRSSVGSDLHKAAVSNSKRIRNAVE